MEARLAEQRRLVDALRDPALYPYPVDRVELIETHISFVLLAGAFAYKIKKAVDLGFVDYLSLAARRFFCSEELRLNGRLAPSLYLGLCAVTGSCEAPRLAGDGEAIEYAVRMKRFAERDLFSEALAAKRLPDSAVDGLGRRLAAFHAAAPRAPQDSEFGSPAAVWAPVAACLAFFASRAEPVESLKAWCEAENLRLAPFFEWRRREGLIRECHGDLHLGNLVLQSGEAFAFDGIEFNPGLRWIDPVCDLAFAVMDFAARGRPELGWRLLGAWLEEGGDFAGLQALRFDQVYRALVRAEVAVLRGADPSPYLDCARRLIRPPRPVLLLMHGFSASGKSRLARRIAPRLGAILLRSDVERKRIAGLAPLARSDSSPDSGLYTEAMTRATLLRLASLADQLLGWGYPVIVDATFLLAWQRRLFLDLAQSRGIAVAILDCRVPRDELRGRLAARLARGRDASEATLDVLEAQFERAEPLAAEELGCALEVRPDRSVAALVRELARLTKVSLGEVQEDA